MNNDSQWCDNCGMPCDHGEIQCTCDATIVETYFRICPYGAFNFERASIAFEYQRLEENFGDIGRAMASGRVIFTGMELVSAADAAHLRRLRA